METYDQYDYEGNCEVCGAHIFEHDRIEELICETVFNRNVRIFDPTAPTQEELYGE